LCRDGRCAQCAGNLAQVAYPQPVPTPPRKGRRGTGPTHTPTSSRALVHLFGVSAEQAPPPKLNQHLHDCAEQLGVVQDPLRRFLMAKVIRAGFDQLATGIDSTPTRKTPKQHLPTVAAHRCKAQFEPVDGKTVCLVDVEPSPAPVYANTDKGADIFYTRLGNTTCVPTMST
jgi:hypothetical protein